METTYIQWLRLVGILQWRSLMHNLWLRVCWASSYEKQRSTRLFVKMKQGIWPLLGFGIYSLFRIKHDLMNISLDLFHTGKWTLLLLCTLRCLFIVIWREASLINFLSRVWNLGYAKFWDLLPLIQRHQDFFLSFDLLKKKSGLL